MTVTITLPPDMEKKLLDRATARGQDVAGYIRRLIEKDMQSALVDEALAPFRRQVEESGMTDEELDAFFQEVREEVWQEKQGKRGGSRE